MSWTPGACGERCFSLNCGHLSLSFSIQTLNLLIDCLLSETNAVGFGGALTDL